MSTLVYIVCNHDSQTLDKLPDSPLATGKTMDIHNLSHIATHASGSAAVMLCHASHVWHLLFHNYRKYMSCSSICMLRHQDKKLAGLKTLVSFSCM